MQSFDAVPRAQLFPQVPQNGGSALLDPETNVPAKHGGEACRLCTSEAPVSLSMAFQPIVNVQTSGVVAYEALARGVRGEPAYTVLSQATDGNRYALDQRCREAAISVSAAVGILETTADLCINFFPNAVYEPRQCLRRTMHAADAVGFPLERIIFEITEVEEIRSQDHLRNIMNEYRKCGLRIAIDDFGAGHSGLTLLSVFQPDIIKIDRALITELDLRPASRSIVRSLVHVSRDLDIRVIAEGIEREQEMKVLCDLGVELMQGYFFARPGFETLPTWPPQDAHA
jgi:EAL domain-containing protein (putative c-di-GMP-specific phosphodiesterase class I)